MAKKRRNGRQAELETLSQALILNGRAMDEQHKRKHWTKHDIQTVKPLTPAQDEMFHAWYNDKHICAHGSAGTGKSFIALYLAINQIIEKKQQRIIIVRSAVPTREIGFLPGSLEEKLMQYELPYHDIMWELVGKKSTYQDMKDVGIIEFMSTSFIRGLTWDNAVVVVDEASNMSMHEIDSILTRIGENTRVILTGDIKQSDLDGKKNGICGLPDALKIFNNMKEFASVKFTKYDIVRSEFVKSWIIASENTT